MGHASQLGPLQEVTATDRVKYRQIVEEDCQYWVRRFPYPPQLNEAATLWQSYGAAGECVLRRAN